MMKKTVFLAVCGMMLQCWAGISGLRGEYRNGQVFLQWQEKDLPADARLSVWSSSEPISVATLGKAEKVAAMLNTRSANDWWLNPQMFHTKRSKKARSEEIFAGKVADTDTAKLKEQGFVITDRGEPLAPDGGLHGLPIGTEVCVGDRCLDHTKGGIEVVCHDVIHELLGK